MHIPAEEKPLPLFKELSFYAEDAKGEQFLSQTLFYDTDEEKISPLPKSLPNTADDEVMDEKENEDENGENIPSLPKTLPYTTDLKRVDDIQKAMWITHLYQFLQSLNKSISPQVNMVFGDSDHMDLVLNWIIAAHVKLDPPLHNIMILSIDQWLPGP